MLSLRRDEGNSHMPHSISTAEQSRGSEAAAVRRFQDAGYDCDANSCTIAGKRLSWDDVIDTYAPELDDSTPMDEAVSVILKKLP